LNFSTLQSYAAFLSSLFAFGESLTTKAHRPTWLKVCSIAFVR
jgi:hypothetical protein